MHLAHFFTSAGPLCDRALRSHHLTLVAEGVTCPGCRAALEQQEREAEARPTPRRRPIAVVGGHTARDRILTLR